MIIRAYRIAQILSIDIVIGVVILLRFFCAQMDVETDWQVYFLLAGTVWLIYTLDHLNDAEKIRNPTRERYIFHSKNRKTLIKISILLLTFLFSLIFFIPVVVLIGGLLLGGCSLLYLVIQHKLSSFLLKEFYVALVYTLGILMVPFLLSQSIRFDFIALLFMLTFLNLIIFSWYERDQDLMDGFKSIATESKEIKIEKLILTIVSAGLGVSVLLSSEVYFYFTLAFPVYGLMAVFPGWFQKSFRYRIIGDGVFLVPILLECI